MNIAGPQHLSSLNPSFCAFAAAAPSAPAAPKLPHGASRERQAPLRRYLGPEAMHYDPKRFKIEEIKLDSSDSSPLLA